MSSPILNAANQLTLLRMALAPALVVLVVSGEMTWALVVFVVAGFSDVLDGMIARLGHQQTSLGAMLDPLADKILLMSSYVALTWTSALRVRIPVWLTVITLSRDAIILVTVAVITLTVGRRVFLPSILGKLSTVLQLLTAGVVILFNALSEDLGAARHLFWLTALFTVASALHYVYLASVSRPEAEP
jgi:cardiolipin synthase (CMP-forming)